MNNQINATATDVDDVHTCGLSITVSDMQSKRMNCNDHDKSWIVNLLHVAINELIILLIIQRCQILTCV